MRATTDAAEPEPASARDALYRPPAPYPVSPTRALWRAISSFERDLITLLPGEAYRPVDMMLGVSRRGIFLLNDPATVRRIMVEDRAIFPKSDLMVGALAPVVGDGLFVSETPVWERHRRMIDPAFAHMRIGRAFAHMAAAVDDAERRLEEAAAAGTALSLDAELSGLTADIVYRTIFSETLDGAAAREVFEAFNRFQHAVANVQLDVLLLRRGFSAVRQPKAAHRAAARIRALMQAKIDARRAHRGTPFDDLAGDILAARDPDTGARFDDRAVLDEIATFFMAGHETTASVLCWALFILSQQPRTVARMRAEIDATVGAGPIDAAAVKRLSFTRCVFRETLRLYPPVTFLARVAARDARIGDLAIPRGAMVLVSPWTLHRCEGLWPAADRFDPDRFAPGREEAIPAGASIPFGLGPRLCIGTAFATMEAVLILAAWIRRWDLEVEAPERVRPVARLTTRPAREIRFRLRPRRDG
ncbi:MAG: cytochrome P450 [Pseudomonadota bacterium]